MPPAVYHKWCSTHHHHPIIVKTSLSSSSTTTLVFREGHQQMPLWWTCHRRHHHLVNSLMLTVVRFSSCGSYSTLMPVCALIVAETFFLVSHLLNLYAQNNICYFAMVIFKILKSILKSLIGFCSKYLTDWHTNNYSQNFSSITLILLSFSSIQGVPKKWLKF